MRYKLTLLLLSGLSTKMSFTCNDLFLLSKPVVAVCCFRCIMQILKQVYLWKKAAFFDKVVDKAIFSDNFFFNYRILFP